MVVRGRDDPTMSACATALSAASTPGRIGTSSRFGECEHFVHLLVGLEDERLAPASATPHRAETDLGTLNVKS